MSLIYLYLITLYLIDISSWLGTKVEAMRLIAHVFKTYEPICAIFTHFNIFLYLTYMLTIFIHQLKL